MAYTIIWMDGFDENGSTGDKYTVGGETSGGSISTDGAFSYGRSCLLPSGAYISKGLGSNYTVVFLHAHIKIAASSTGDKQLFVFRDEANNVSQFEVQVGYDGVSAYKLKLYRGSTLVATSTAGIPVGIWTALSIRYVCNSSTGECSAQINGASAVSFTGNTQNGGAAQVNRVLINNATGVNVGIDNWVLATGLSTDAILPECRIYGAVVPTGNSSVQFTPNAGSNWSNVNEIPANEDASYNYMASPGYKDVFTCSPPALTGAILAVKVNFRARKDDANSIQCAAVIQPGSTPYTSPAMPLYTTYFEQGAIWQTNPATSAAWTPSDLASLKFGYASAN